MSKSIVLVTGAGTGIGHLSVKALALAGHTVYASMRDLSTVATPQRCASCATGPSPTAPMCGRWSWMCCRRPRPTRRWQTIIAERGRLDVVVHNAGHLVIGPTEAFTPEEINKVFDTNFLGTQRVNKAVLPVMRRQQQGLVLWVSSSTTRGGFPPFLGPYAAAKAAMDSIAVTMAYELARFNIETSIVVPGAFTAGTDHFANAGHPADAATSAAYDARYEGLMDQVGARLNALMPPEADPAAVAADIAYIVGLPHGTRPFRSITDFRR